MAPRGSPGAGTQTSDFQIPHSWESSLELAETPLKGPSMDGFHGPASALRPTHCVVREGEWPERMAHTLSALDRNRGWGVYRSWWVWSWPFWLGVPVLPLASCRLVELLSMPGASVSQCVKQCPSHWVALRVRVLEHEKCLLGRVPGPMNECSSPYPSLAGGCEIQRTTSIFFFSKENLVLPNKSL